MLKNFKKYICTFFCMMTLSVTALASTWPEKPVTIVVPIDAGFVQDTTARQLAKYLSKEWNQPVNVVNRPGSAGVIGTQAVVNSAPDGYTLGYASAPFTGTFASGKNLPYKREDIAGVSMFARQAFLIFASGSAPYNTVQEMLDWAAANPGKFDYGTPGTGSYTHIHMEYLAKLRKVEFRHIPYRALGQGVIDTSTGRIHAITTVLNSAIEGQIARGNIKIIGSFGDSFVHNGKTVPSISDVVPEIKTQGYYALIAPKGTPPAVIQKIANDTKRAMADPEVSKFFADNAVQTMPILAGDKLDVWFDNEIARLRKSIHRANIKLE